MAMVGIVEAKVAVQSLQAALQWASGSYKGAQLASYSHPVSLDWMPSLYHWWRQGGSIQFAIGGQNQSNIKSGGTEKAQGKKG